MNRHGILIAVSNSPCFTVASTHTTGHLAKAVHQRGAGLSKLARRASSLYSLRLCLEFCDEGLGGHRRREHAIGSIRGRTVPLLRSRRRAIRERHDVETLFTCCAHRRLNAAIRQEAAKSNGLDAMGLELRFQVSARECVQTLPC